MVLTVVEEGIVSSCTEQCVDVFFVCIMSTSYVMMITTESSRTVIIIVA